MSSCSTIMTNFLPILQQDFDDNEDSSESDILPTYGNVELNYSDEDGSKFNAQEEESHPTVAGRVKRSKRKRTLPKKLKSPLSYEKSAKRVGNTALKEMASKGKG